MLEAVEKGKTTNKYVFGAYKAIQLVTVRRLFLIPTRLHYNQVIAELRRPKAAKRSPIPILGN